jgi:hypothetical protein
MFTRWLPTGCILFSLLLVTLRLPGDEPADGKAPLNAMMRRVGQLKMTYAADSGRARPELLTTPVLRCNDPTRDEQDGAVWLWTEDKRPVAALCVLLYASGKWNYENIALCDEALLVTGRPSWSWEPQATKRQWTRLAEPVPATPRSRQSAMRAIARSLDASETRRGEVFPLRLLERPIYHYSDEDQGILEGALFALSYGTNPELFAQIEARTDKDGSRWQIAFARLSAAEITVKHGEKTLWQVEAKKADDPRAPYYGVNELPSEE